MSEKGPEGEGSTDWRKKYSKIVEHCSFPVHVIVAVGAVGEVFHSEGITVLKLVCAAAAVYSWYYFYRIRTRRVISSLTGEERPASSIALRRCALGFLLGIPTIAALYPVFWYWFWPRRYAYFPRDEFVIAVADFEGPEKGLEKDKYGITKLLRERLDTVAQPYHDILVEGLGSSVPNSVSARKRGREHGAAMVIWGWYRVSSERALLAAHVELLREPRFRWLQAAAETQNVALAELDSFELQTRQAKDMSYLALLAVGVARLEAGGDLKQVLSILTDALSQQSAPEPMVELADGYFLRGTAYHHLDDSANALKDYDQALALRPQFAEALNNRGAMFLSKGDLDRALSDFDQAVGWKPGLAQIYANRAVALCRRRDYGPARRNLDRAIELRPDVPIAYNLRGFTAAEQGDFGSAIADFHQAIRMNHSYAIAYNNRGIVYTRQGKFDQAIEDYNRALKINPNYAEAYNNRGVAYFHRLEFQKALQDYRAALALRPDYQDAHHNLGDACAKAFDRPCAVASYQAARRLAVDPRERARIDGKLRALGVP
jgi:tetratricopeptide (TPR) repeat protein